MGPSRSHRSPLRRALGALPCALTLALALGASTSTSASGAATPGPDYFGINAQNVFKLPEADWDRQLAAIARTGVGEVRRDAFWSQVELTRPVHGIHTYTWTRSDAVISALAHNRLRWYPILDYATSWEGTLPGPSGWKSAPASAADFAAYAAAFARRYGSGGAFWAAHPTLPALPVQSYEVWNEPNLPEFWPDVSGAADRYADLLAATVPALRAADPHGRVVLGGLSSVGLTPFLDRVEATHPGLIAQTDAVAFHPYGTTFANTGARVRVLRDWLDAHGARALPIDVTETGWATPPLPEGTRAARMAALVPGLARSSCDIAHVIVHTWLTPDVDANDPNDYFGIAHADASLKPTGAAFAAAVATVEGGTGGAPADPCAGRAAAAPLAPPPSDLPPSDPPPADPPAPPADPPPADLPPVVPPPARALQPPALTTSALLSPAAVVAPRAPALRRAVRRRRASASARAVARRRHRRHVRRHRARRAARAHGGPARPPAALSVA